MLVTEQSLEWVSGRPTVASAVCAWQNMASLINRGPVVWPQMIGRYVSPRHARQTWSVPQGLGRPPHLLRLLIEFFEVNVVQVVGHVDVNVFPALGEGRRPVGTAGRLRR